MEIFLGCFLVKMLISISASFCKIKIFKSFLGFLVKNVNWNFSYFLLSPDFGNFSWWFSGKNVNSDFSSFLWSQDFGKFCWLFSGLNFQIWPFIVESRF